MGRPHLREFERRCICGKRAVVEPYDENDNHRGVYCRPCGRDQLVNIKTGEGVHGDE